MVVGESPSSLSSLAVMQMDDDLSVHLNVYISTRDVFYVRREVDLKKTAKVNAYIMHIFGKIELLSIHATYNYFKMHYFNVF